MKSLDLKLARILDNPGCSDFILADAKDADMAAGMAAPGKSPEHHAQEGKFRSLQEYREQIRANVKQGLIDIMLMSASSNEVLTFGERLFENSHITPAIRANDTTDIWMAAGGSYQKDPAQPFRSASLDHAMCGKLDCEPEERKLGADLGLYSVTYNNDTTLDAITLNAYSEFRLEAERKGFRHFLEIFDPNAPQKPIPNLGRFINDNIARTLAGVAGKGRPIFLKVAYHGPAAMEELVSYDRSLVVGILGGSSGTTFDAFHQLWEARKYGAKVALYGRMINNSEHQLTFIQHLRWLGDGELKDPAEAVRSYHGALQNLGIRPYRELAEDLQSTLRASAYGGKGGQTKSLPQAKPESPSEKSEQPDFQKMSAAEKLAWNQQRLNRLFGKFQG
ncbi:MAG: hypothetical protein KDA78_17205 [Planctomycetaceae bacterium]|nr:hypothetical protein [Planctomycetaceae bacterium]